jgi:hypothetical protein
VLVALDIGRPGYLPVRDLQVASNHPMYDAGGRRLDRPNFLSRATDARRRPASDGCVGCRGDSTRSTFSIIDARAPLITTSDRGAWCRRSHSSHSPPSRIVVG